MDKFKRADLRLILLSPVWLLWSFRKLAKVLVKSTCKIIFEKEVCIKCKNCLAKEVKEEDKSTNTCHDLDHRKLGQDMHLNLIWWDLERHLEAARVVLCMHALFCSLYKRLIWKLNNAVKVFIVTTARRPNCIVQIIQVDQVGDF